jgi:hypothetical protein
MQSVVLRAGNVQPEDRDTRRTWDLWNGLNNDAPDLVLTAFTVKVADIETGTIPQCVHGWD